MYVLKTILLGDSKIVRTCVCLHNVCVLIQWYNQSVDWPPDTIKRW